MKPLLLIDSMNLTYRSQYAFMGLQTKEGVPTGILHGYLSSLLRLIQNYSPNVCVCWDATRCWRYNIFPNYRLHRHEAPPKETPQQQVTRIAAKTALEEQKAKLMTMLSTLGIMQICSEWLEADDLFSLIVNEVAGRRRVYIYSNDRDAYQNLRYNVSVLRQTDGIVEVTADAVQKQYGISPTLWPTYLALGGDTSDGIKELQLNRVGEKNALKLVQSGLDLSDMAVTKRFISRYTGKYPIAASIENLRLAYALVKSPESMAQLQAPPINLPNKLVSGLTKGIASAAAFEHLPLSESAYNCRLQEFTRFCADHDLNVILSNRRKFFFI